MLLQNVGESDNALVCVCVCFYMNVWVCVHVATLLYSIDHHVLSTTIIRRSITAGMWMTVSVLPSSKSSFASKRKKNTQRQRMPSISGNKNDHARVRSPWVVCTM
jgi:hypothetical protein